MNDAFEFDEEKATSWEVGAKTRFLNGRAIFNAALYHTDIKDLQVSVFDGVLGYVVGNAMRGPRASRSTADLQSRRT